MVPETRRVMSSRSRRWFVGAAGCAAVVALLGGGPARAHEIGTTRVSIVFHERRTYDVEIVTDAASLVEKLEASTGRSMQPDTNPGRLLSLLNDFDESFRHRVKLAFDESEVRPGITYAVTPPRDAASAAFATIRLTGQ